MSSAQYHTGHAPLACKCRCLAVGGPMFMCIGMSSSGSQDYVIKIWGSTTDIF